MSLQSQLDGRQTPMRRRARQRPPARPGSDRAGRARMVERRRAASWAWCGRTRSSSSRCAAERRPVRQRDPPTPGEAAGPMPPRAPGPDPCWAARSPGWRSLAFVLSLGWWRQCASTRWAWPLAIAVVAGLYAGCSPTAGCTARPTPAAVLRRRCRLGLVAMAGGPRRRRFGPATASHRPARRRAGLAAADPGWPGALLLGCAAPIPTCPGWMRCPPRQHRRAG